MNKLICESLLRKCPEFFRLTNRFLFSFLRVTGLVGNEFQFDSQWFGGGVDLPTV